MIKGTYILNLLLLFLCMQSVAQPNLQQKMRLRGAYDRGHIKLYWEIFEWPEELMGFNVKRKEGEQGSWQQLNTEMISPQVGERNWKNVGLNKDQEAHIQKNLNAYVASGSMKRVSSTVMLSRFRQVGGPQAGDRLRMKEEFEIALILGFGFIDNTYSKGKEYTYAIFPVDTNNRETEAPAVIFSPEKVKKVAPQIAFRVKSKKIELKWELSESLYEQAALYGFIVFRSENGKDNLVRLTENPIGYVTTKTAMLGWQFTDPTGDAGKDYTYHFHPVTIFQFSLEGFKAKYQAKKNVPMVALDIDTIQYQQQTKLKLVWSYPDSLKSMKKRFARLSLERKDPDSLTFRSIWNTNSIKVNSYVDTSMLQYGQAYQYRLVVTDNGGNSYPGKPFLLFYEGYKRPAAPKDLTGEFKWVGEKSYVHLNWKNISHPLIDGYQLEVDAMKEFEYLKLANIPLIRGNSFLYEIKDDGGRTYHFRLIPVTPNGFKGDTATVSCFVPQLYIPPFVKINAKLSEKNSVQLEWDYPANIPLKGFNIKMNDTTLLSYNSIGKEVRKFELSGFLPSDFNKLNRFYVEAIGEAAKRISQGPSVFLKDPKVSKPVELRVDLKRENKEWYAFLTWKLENGSSEQPKEFILFSDEKNEGEILPTIRIKNKGEFIHQFKIPDPYRDTYSFRIAAVAKDGSVSPSSQFILNMGQEKKR